MNACSCLTLILGCIVYWQAREISRLAAPPDFPLDPDLAPGVQHGEEADLGAQVARVGGGSPQRPATTGRPAARRAVGMAATTPRADGEHAVAVWQVFWRSGRSTASERAGQAPTGRLSLRATSKARPPRPARSPPRNRMRDPRNRSSFSCAPASRIAFSVTS